MIGAMAAAQLDGENPWPGLESFKEDASAFFHGRDREAESLLGHVLDAPVTVLYGKSGLGKTSLLRASLFPVAAPAPFSAGVCALGACSAVRRRSLASYINPSTTRFEPRCPMRRRR